MVHFGHILWNRLAHWLVRPKRLAVFEACLIGLVSGLAALLLGDCVGWLGGWRRMMAHWLPVYYALPMIGLVGGWLAGWLIERFAPAASGSGMSEVKAVLAQVPLPLNLRIALVKLVSAAMVLGAGMPLGKEGPTVQIGAALANQLSRWFPTSPDHRRQLVAAGAGAGLAAAFDAPIAGVLFVVEELLQDVSGITLGTAILASFIASVVARITGSHSLSLDLHLTASNTSFDALEIPFYLLLGILAGLLGVLFNRGILISLMLYQRFLQMGLPWRIGLAGLITGLALSTLPVELRDYTAVRNLLLTGDFGWQLVGFLFCFQFLLILITYGSGAPAGLLVPSLTLGAALGYIVGTWEHHWLGLSAATTYARVGMGAFFCGVARVPITGVIIVFEMTTDFNLVLPLMIGSVTAYLIGELVEKGSLYDHLLEFRGIHLTKDTAERAPWTALTAADIMQRQVETLTCQITLEEALQAFSQSSHRTFPVVKQGRLVGILTQKDLAKAAQVRSAAALTVAAVMTPEPITATPDDTLAHILHLLNRYNVSSLPVTEGRRLVGIITRSDIIRVEAAHLSGEADLSGPKATPSQVIYQTRSPETGRGRLLIPLSNPQTAAPLLALAIAIARERHYEIECLHVIVVPRHQSPTAATVSTAAGQRLLRQAIRRAQSWHIPIHTQIRVTHDLGSAMLQSIKERHINLVLMGWKGSTATPGRVFSRVVDTMIRQAACCVVLVKLQEESHFDRWFVPIAGGPNAQQAMQLLPALASLSKTPEIKLCQVFESNNVAPDTSLLEKAAHTLQTHLNAEITTVPICARSIPEALLDCARRSHSQVIIMGASREGLLQQAMHGNIPAAIARSNQQTVILVRSS
jgi:CIC family chloride channel protein